MKKLSIVSSAILILSTTMISCTKNEAKNIKEQPQTSNSNLARYGGEWIAYNGPDEDCKGTGSTCYELGPIIITPKYQYIKSAAQSGSSGTVGSTFGDPYLQDVCDEMDPSMVTKLQSGNYFLAVNHEDGNVINFIAGQNPQLTSQNMEFAFQLKK